MYFSRAGLPLAAFAAGLLVTTSVMAAQAAPAPAPAPAAAPIAAPTVAPAVAPPGGDQAWVKICSTDPASKKELCLVIQELHAETGQFIASATIRQITGDTKISFIAAVPTGMLLQPGLRIQVDTGKQFDLKYGICFPTACYGELPIDADFINSMKNGKQVIITTMNQSQKGVAFPITLAGFTKAYEGKGLDPQEAQKREDDLNKALQARAEDARKRLLEQQQKETTAPAQ